MDIFSRTRLLLGDEAMKKLSESRVAVFGIGGVGAHAAEALVRSGIGSMDIIDNDTVSETNINRQLFALRSTVGLYKTDVAARRFADINPELNLNCFKTFFTHETSHLFDFSEYDYVLDAIDTVSGKTELVVKAAEASAPIISCMGAGNKLDPALFRVADIYKTQGCPLAKVMRRELKKLGIKKLKVVYSPELPLTPASSDEALPPGKRQIPGSCAFVPSVAGLIMAGEVIRDLTGR